MSRRMPLAEIERRHNSIGLLTTLIGAAQRID
jgi:hypothetical protein